MLHANEHAKNSFGDFLAKFQLEKVHIVPQLVHGIDHWWACKKRRRDDTILGFNLKRKTKFTFVHP